MNLEKLSHGPGQSGGLLSADRATFEMRRGRLLCLTSKKDSPLLVVPTETVTERALSLMQKISGRDPDLAITHHRAKTLKVRLYTDQIVLVPFPAWLTADMARSLADPTTDLNHPLRGPFTAKRDPLSDGTLAAVQLAKSARLLPSVIMVKLERLDLNQLEQNDILSVSSENADAYEYDSSGTLHQVAAAKVPLEDAEDTQILAFRSTDGGREHLAIVVGNPMSDKPVLIRLHSECFTGDLIGSLKCDCGQQLRGAIAQISEEGSGVLLYLRQEGRGIGLLNKLRAYALQGQGFDTVEANERLGFDSDERIFLPAAHILKQLGYRRVRLMTNNPDKVEGLQQYGVEVTERVEHKFPSNQHNEFYLSVKREKSGHLL